MDTMRWEKDSLLLLDQTKLPQKVEYLKCKDYQTVAKAIRDLSVRGAPAIGVAAAYGLVLGLSEKQFNTSEDFIAEAKRIARELWLTRPTAVNLRWALERMLQKMNEANAASLTPAQLKNMLLQEAHAILSDDVNANKAIGNYGEKLIPDMARILTHCNAGALATAGYGTALGVIRAAKEAGKEISVFADETRPLLQGARLTAWEMVQEKIPVTLITDNMAASLMAQQMVDLVIVGADRIASNGDTANKIGTYGVALLAREHKIPFYVAAPVSTVDLKIKQGKDIPIEERNYLEVTHILGQMIAPEGVKVWNPAFDVTPNLLITAIITERGVITPPYDKNLALIMG
ncbi:MAG: Methylthioribose-1-phosphate isomerase [Desulfotomaculum sp. 46_296]|nr:MAG: Methylthioribose-1-phosphate isomerase [Desulfotomaculum sp. 46_296]HAU31582.1 S-methyl-5-thioribose-1-phosphate isomerase [Desulfotomaculum sp.]